MSGERTVRDTTTARPVVSVVACSWCRALVPEPAWPVHQLHERGVLDALRRVAQRHHEPLPDGPDPIPVDIAITTNPGGTP